MGIAKEKVPDKLELRSANPTSNIEEVFCMKDIRSLEYASYRRQQHTVFVSEYRDRQHIVQTKQISDSFCADYVMKKERKL